MKQIPTLLRIAEHKALEKVTLSGSVLDMGGDTHAEYRRLLKGGYTIKTINLDTKTSPDFTFDLEKPLELPDSSYDHILMINVLEHIYHARELLAEAVRVVRPGGSVVIVVPFLFPIHADPHDYWRFSNETLKKMAEEQGLSSIEITPLGTGVFAARYVMLDRLMPTSVRVLLSYTIQKIVGTLDGVFVALARFLGKKYVPSDYALGYCLTATASKT